MVYILMIQFSFDIYLNARQFYHEKDIEPSVFEFFFLLKKKFGIDSFTSSVHFKRKIGNIKLFIGLSTKITIITGFKFGLKIGRCFVLYGEKFFV